MGALERLEAYCESSRKKYPKRTKNSAGGENKRAATMDRVRSLAEGIILQAMEDLWDNDHHQESANFFKGDGFNICAALARIDMKQRHQIMRMVALPLAKKSNGTAPDKKR
jgi:hypothetical protein